jgi:hypothetical protein
MIYRIYIAADGTAWKVWEVTTAFAERRRTERRAVGLGTAPSARERRAAERRKVREVRAPTRPGFENGWLTFESTSETRRIGPVPPRWSTLSDAELEALRKRALARPPVTRRLIE